MQTINIWLMYIIGLLQGVLCSLLGVYLGFILADTIKDMIDFRIRKHKRRKNESKC